MKARQRGLAVVTALLIVAVAASAAALMLAQQSAMLDQTAMVAVRAQADAYAQAGIDWARGVLAEDKGRRGDVDSLDEGWAQPIAALPVERAVVSGIIVDEQGKFNLNNLDQAATPRDKLVFRTLLGSLGLSPDLIGPVMDWVSSVEAPENAYYLSLAKPYRAANQRMIQVDELYRVRGFDAAAVARLRPYVTALPEHTPINVNTAPDAVLAALVGGAKDVVDKIKQKRSAKGGIVKVDDFASIPGVPPDAQGVDVKSGFFSVSVQVAQDDVRLASDALIARKIDNTTAIIWRRPRY
jgi:general secretion pathway protein K